MNKLFALTAAVTLAACSPAPQQPELAPIFMIMCADVDPEEPPHPCCTGFAMGGQVVTASHCVPGASALLVSRQQWVETSNAAEVGLVVARDEVRDIAWLSAELEAQLERGAPIAAGADVAALTLSGSKHGIADTQAGSFWLTDMDTHMGDSGAAVVDASGAAVGVLSRCLTADGKECDPHTGIFAELP